MSGHANKSHKVGPKGQVVIPKAVRDRIGIQPGDEVFIDVHGGDARVRPTARGVGGLRGAAPSTPTGMADWEAEKAAEREREAARERRGSRTAP